MIMNFDRIALGITKLIGVSVYSHRPTPHSPIPIKWMLIVIVPSSPAMQSFTSLFSNYSYEVFLPWSNLYSFLLSFTVAGRTRISYPLTSTCIHCIQIHVYLLNSKVDAIDMVKKKLSPLTILYVTD